MTNQPLSTGEPGRALRRDAAENRERLLRAAQQVFAEQGLDACVDEVARVAGVGTGTLYRRFPTKDALINELVRDLTNRILELARSAQSAPAGTGLEVFLYAAGELLAANRGCLPRLWNNPDTVEIKDECRGVIAELLADGQTQGVVRDDAFITDIDLMFWALRGIIEATEGLGHPGARRQIAIFIAGLSPSGRALTSPALANEDVLLARKSALVRN
jgi:AcrR family transcriptional regulator